MCMVANLLETNTYTYIPFVCREKRKSMLAKAIKKHVSAALLKGCVCMYVCLSVCMCMQTCVSRST